MRLIDADALWKKIKEFRDDMPQATARRYVCNSIMSVLADENQAPTIEAEPVKHGKWIDGADSFGAPRGKYRVCSVCNVCIPKMREVPDQYWQGCPNCLSKMDLKGE